MKLLEILKLLAFTDPTADTSMAMSAAMGLAMKKDKDEEPAKEPEVSKI